MEEILNIFRVVECRGSIGGLRGLLLVSWFSRIDSLPYAEFSEIGEGYLQFPDGLSSGDEVLGLARYSFLLNSGHDWQLDRWW